MLFSKKKKKSEGVTRFHFLFPLPKRFLRNPGSTESLPSSPMMIHTSMALSGQGGLARRPAGSGLSHKRTPLLWGQNWRDAAAEGAEAQRKEGRASGRGVATGSQGPPALLPAAGRAQPLLGAAMPTSPTQPLLASVPTVQPIPTPPPAETGASGSPLSHTPDLWGCLRDPKPPPSPAAWAERPHSRAPGPGMSPPDTISLISFPLSGGREDDSFLF